MKIEREKTRLKAYFFGHYDSRGGAMLVTAANFVEALLKYAENFGYDASGDDEELNNNVIDGCAEDFEQQLEVVFCDADPGSEDRELLDGYAPVGEGGYSYGVIQQSFNGDSAPYDTGIAVLWQGDPPKLHGSMSPVPGGTCQIDVRDPGEDAYGLFLLRA